MSKATVIEVPTGDIKLKAYGLTREGNRRSVWVNAVSLAKQHGIRVAFFTVDCTRTGLEFLQQIYLAALEAGAAELVVVDTIGVCGAGSGGLPGRRGRSAGSATAYHPLARAQRFRVWNGRARWRRCIAGTTWVLFGTINGMGERAGNLATWAKPLWLLSCLYGMPVEINLAKLRETSKTVAAGSGYPEWKTFKAAVGNNLFNRESGAVATQFHIPEAIEPYAADLVGATRGIVLGKKSGHRLDPDHASRELGLDVAAPTDQRRAARGRSKRLGTARAAASSPTPTIRRLVRSTRSAPTGPLPTG